LLHQHRLFIKNIITANFKKVKQIPQIIMHLDVADFQTASTAGQFVVKSERH